MPKVCRTVSRLCAGMLLISRMMCRSRRVLPPSAAMWPKPLPAAPGRFCCVECPVSMATSIPAGKKGRQAENPVPVHTLVDWKKLSRGGREPSGYFAEAGHPVAHMRGEPSCVLPDDSNGREALALRPLTLTQRNCVVIGAIDGRHSIWQAGGKQDYGDGYGDQTIPSPLAGLAKAQ